MPQSETDLHITDSLRCEEVPPEGNEVRWYVVLIDGFKHGSRLVAHGLFHLSQGLFIQRSASQAYHRCASRFVVHSWSSEHRFL